MCWLSASCWCCKDFSHTLPPQLLSDGARGVFILHVSIHLCMLHVLLCIVCCLRANSLDHSTTALSFLLLTTIRQAPGAAQDTAKKQMQMQVLHAEIVNMPVLHIKIGYRMAGNDALHTRVSMSISIFYILPMYIYLYLYPYTYQNRLVHSRIPSYVKTDLLTQIRLSYINRDL